MFLRVKLKLHHDVTSVFGGNFGRSILFVWLFLLFQHLKYCSLCRTQSGGTSDREVTSGLRDRLLSAGLLQTLA